MQSSPIKLSEPDIGAELIDCCAEVHRALARESRLSSVEQFEALFSAFMERPAVGLQSGTAALHLALKAAGIDEGDEVIVPTFSFAACCHSISYQRAVPVFLDCEPCSWNLDSELLKRFLVKRARTNCLPKAILVVHNYGQCADLESLIEICDRYELILIEDTAEAIGAVFQGKRAGTLGHLGIFSFNCNKIITGLGGGALASNRLDWVDKVRYWSCQSKASGPDYIHEELGYNYRMNPVSAALVSRQLPTLEARVAKRRAIFEKYLHEFQSLEGMEPQAGCFASAKMDYRTDRPSTERAWLLSQDRASRTCCTSQTRHSRWLSCFLVDERKFGMSAADLIRNLGDSNIEARHVWRPMHTQSLYKRCECIGGSVAEDLHRRGICLPSSSSLTQMEQEFIIDRIRKAHLQSRAGNKNS